MRIDAEHVQSWLKSTPGAFVAGPEYSEEFSQRIDVLPWNRGGTSLSWNDVPYIRLDLNDPAREQIFRSTRPSGHTHAFLLLGRREPGIVCTIDDLLESLDEVYWKSPGNRYFCGAEVISGKLRLAPGDYAEYDGGQWVRLTSKI